jgi:hypothetical protein
MAWPQYALNTSLASTEAHAALVVADKRSPRTFFVHGPSEWIWSALRATV